MDRISILNTAIDVLYQRGQTHNADGGLENSFNMIAEFWTTYLKHPITPHDVAIMMMLLKTARARCGNYCADNYVDMGGYAACAGEIRSKMNRVIENAGSSNDVT